MKRFGPVAGLLIALAAGPASGAIVREETVTGMTAAMSLSLPSIGGGTDQTYVLSIVTEFDVNVTSVTGGGLTWSEQVNQCPTDPGEPGIRLWTSQGSPAGSFAAVITLASSTDVPAVLSRYSGVDIIEDPTGENANGEAGACTGNIDTPTATLTLTSSQPNSVHVVAVGVENHEYVSVTAGYSFLGGATENLAGIRVFDKLFGAATTDTFQAILDLNTDWTTAGVVLVPAVIADLTIVKSVNIHDPAAMGFHALPGQDMIYTLQVTNAGDAVNPDTIFVIDAIPADMVFYNDDMDDGGPATGPVYFSDGASGLTCCLVADIEYSSSTMPPPVFGYVPTVGYDPNVHYIRINPKGTMNPGGSPDPTFSLQFRTRIN